MMANQNPFWIAASQAMLNQAMQQQQQQQHRPIAMHGSADQQQQPQHALYSETDLSIRPNFNITNPTSTYDPQRIPEGAPMLQNAPSSDLQAMERHHLAASSGLFTSSRTTAPLAASAFDSCNRPTFSTHQPGSHPTFPTSAAPHPTINPEAAATAMYEGLSSGTLSDYDMLVLAHAAGLINDHGDLLSTGESAPKNGVIFGHTELSLGWWARKAGTKLHEKKP